MYAAFNERDEADFVVNRIRDWVERGGARSEVAVLYRSNAQSRVFEEAFLNARMPYRVYGGLRFFERAEIKDALAYLRLIASRADDTSFERVVNLPTRGIGAKTLDQLRETARAKGTSLWMAASVASRTGSRSARLRHFRGSCRPSTSSPRRSAGSSCTTKSTTSCNRAASSSITRKKKASAARRGWRIFSSS